MKHYLSIAKEYFQYLEGLHLYPTYKSFWFWAWVLATSVWVGAIVYIFMWHLDRGVSTLIYIAAPEVVWLTVTFRISSLKDRNFVAVTNQRLKTDFKSPNECRSHVLGSLMCVPSSEYLKTAKEIDDLLSIQRKFRKYSDLTFSELFKNIYDKDSKARLLTLTIALFSMTVALAAKSNANLESIFDAYTNPDGRRFILIVSVFSIVLFMASIGLRMFALNIADGLASWSIKIFGGSMFVDWLLAYLVRDLTYYHREPTVEAQSAELGKDVEHMDLADINHLPDLGNGKIMALEKSSS